MPATTGKPGMNNASTLVCDLLFRLVYEQIPLHVQSPGYLKSFPRLPDDYCAPMFDSGDGGTAVGARVLTRILRSTDQSRGSKVVRGVSVRAAASISQGNLVAISYGRCAVRYPLPRQLYV